MVYGRKPTRVTFQSSGAHFATAKEAYVWLVDKFLAARPNLLDDTGDGILGGWGREYFARCPKELFRTSPHLVEEPGFVEPVTGGWFAMVKLDNAQKRRILKWLAAHGGFQYGTDWTWDDGSQPAHTAGKLDAPIALAGRRRRRATFDPSLILDLGDLL